MVTDISEILASIQGKPYYRMIRDLMRDKTVLDVGCGNGLIGYSFQKDVGAIVTQIDVYDSRHPATSEIPFTLTSAESLPYLNNLFDVVYAQFVLHHIESNALVERVVKEMARVTSKQLIIHEEIATPRTNILVAKEYDEQMNVLFNPGNPMKVYNYYTREEIESLGTESGLELAEHRVLKEGTNEDGYLQKHMFVFDKH